jgi:cytochrome c553
MNKMVVLVMFSTFTFVSPWTQAADVEAGKQKAQTCAVCHGAEGKSPPNELWPNLAGQKAAYLAKQLKAFRDGARTDPLMNPMAKPLTDADIENLAAYFSSLQ